MAVAEIGLGVKVAGSGGEMVGAGNNTINDRVTKYIEQAGVSDERDSDSTPPECG